MTRDDAVHNRQPKPVPLPTGLVVKNGSKMRARVASSIPHPVSATLRRAITRCRFAEFFRALGEPELGALLICDADFDVAAAGGGEVSLTRDQTIMQGASSCTFRFKFAPR
jgi:hypothetical protein